MAQEPLGRAAAAGPAGQTESGSRRRTRPEREQPDVETASDDYARRFAGSVGAWFLDLQARSTLDLLRRFPPGATVLDVGGGHGQLTPALLEAGYEVVILGSAPEAGERIARFCESGRCRFTVGDLTNLPYATRSFDVVISFRLLPHMRAWRRVIAEACRVARATVIVDYPSSRSINVFADRLFGLKRRIERNTRPFTLFHPRDIARAFAEHGFVITGSRPQFLWPMVLHRAHGSRLLGVTTEAVPRALGLTRLLGSPVIARAERRPDSHSER